MHVQNSNVQVSNGIIFKLNKYIYELFNVKLDFGYLVLKYCSNTRDVSWKIKKKKKKS